MLLTTRNGTLGLTLTVTDGANGGVTGLVPKLRLRHGASATSYLDFNDNTFKTSGWTTQDVNMIEVGNGHYRYSIDFSLIASLANGDSVVAEYRNASAPAFDQSDIVIIDHVERVGLTLTANTNGGVTGLSPTVMIRDAITNHYLDFNDNTFKSSGWTTPSTAMTEVGRGHYTKAVDTSLWTGLSSGGFVAEYHAAGPPEIDGSDGPTAATVLGAGSGDIIAPVVNTFSPTPGTAVGKHDPVSFRVTDNSGSLSNVIVWVVFPDTGDAEMIFDNDIFLPRYIGLSTKTSITNGFAFSLRRSGGWLADDFVLKIKAIDPSGNETEATYP